MAENSKIEWTDHTFNPWTGCTKVSDGCALCYAEGWSKRAGAKVGKWGPGMPRVRTTPANWRQPLKWDAQAEAEGRRFRVFCASLADVFDNAVPAEWRDDLYELIYSTPHLDWLLLTKRIGNVKGMLPARGRLPSNVWLGATICNQQEADRDIPKLLAVPAAKRFLSIEPLLGPVDLTRIDVFGGDAEIYPLKGTTDCVNDEGEPHEDVPALDWVIVGGESGHGARPMHPDWARSLRDQCAETGVPFLFKQWGEWLPTEREGADVVLRMPDISHPGPKQPEFTEWPCGQGAARVGKKAAGRMLDGRTHDGLPGSEVAHG